MARKRYLDEDITLVWLGQFIPGFGRGAQNYRCIVDRKALARFGKDLAQSHSEPGAPSQIANLEG